MTSNTTTYKKTSHIEHILLRPQMYLGTLSCESSDEYVAEQNSETGKYTIVNKTINFSQGLLRIFVEALSNALDNVERSKNTDTPTKYIKIFIDPESGKTSIENDGCVIPIEIHEKEKIYIHSLIFGHLLTSSNYDDNKDRVLSGTYGYGIKLLNIFSKSMTVEARDMAHTFKQSWKNNMKEKDKPKIGENKDGKVGFTRVTWYPDFEKFKLENYTDDIINLYTKFILDAAMLVPQVKITLNGKRVNVASLKDYAKLYDPNLSQSLMVSNTETMKVLIAPSHNGVHNAISFVNGVYTRRGGKHVDTWVDTLIKPILQKLNKKDKPQINMNDAKSVFTLYVVATVIKPEFDSQDKHYLAKPVIKSNVQQKDLNSLMKWECIESLKDILKGKELIELKKTERGKKKFVKVEGLVPANNAGGKFSDKCTLILCEGLSAKTYAVAGIEKGINGLKGLDWFGIYPMRGKFLNVREKSPSAISKNAVVSDIVKAIGLQYGTDYNNRENIQNLNYGKVVILADADCFTNDTPIIIKKNGIIDITTMESIVEWTDKRDSILIQDTEVWSSVGWTKLLAIKRRPVTKKTLEISTPTGIVKCSEGHSFSKTEKLTAKDLKVGDTLTRIRKQEPINTGNLQDDAKKLHISINKNTDEDLKKVIDYENSLCKNPFENFEYNNSISEDEAWVWGFFFADGSCGVYTFEKDRSKETERNSIRSRERWEKWVIHHTNTIEELENKENKTNNEKRKLYATRKRLEKAKENTTRTANTKKDTLIRTNYSWYIDNCNIELLEKCKNILENIYPEHEYNIIKWREENNNHNSCYRLLLNGGKKVEKYIKEWREMFYDRNIKQNKKIPSLILNSSKEVYQQFLDGFYWGDGNKSERLSDYHFSFAVLGQIAAQGLCFIIESLGYEYNLHKNKSKNDVYNISYYTSDKYKRKLDINKIKSIEEVEYTHEYYYDIETEVHNLNAGIGQLKIFQCDGLHIESLVLNFFHVLFPGLLEHGFVESMKTPVARIFGKNKTSDLLFYDSNSYDEYKQTHDKFKMRFYKGLGSARVEDVPDTFGVKMLSYKKDEEADNNMELFFSKKTSDKRKDWLLTYDKNDTIGLDDYQSQYMDLSMSDFINKELIKFSISANIRAIPNLMDGLKPSQRKVLHACKIRKLWYKNESLKVAQLGGYTAEKTLYHHGEANLFDTIINMAQNYTGSNNIPLLYPDGMFGSRIENGADSAQPRYIYTKFNKHTSDIFKESDDAILNYLSEDGQKIEPDFFAPIIPMVLVNGVTGIGLGWSSSIPCFNPKQIVQYIKSYLNDSDDLIELHPWYNGFNGEIKYNEKDNRYETWGKLTRIKKNVVAITELPIGMSMSQFKDWCESKLADKAIHSVKYGFSTDKVYFEIRENPDGFKLTLENTGLVSYIKLSNMVLWHNGELKKYDNVTDIIDDFCMIRYNLYVKRRQHEIDELEKVIRFITNKVKFIMEIINNTLDIMNTPEEEIIVHLNTNGYDLVDNSYLYLLNLHIRSLTKEKVAELQKELGNKNLELEKLKSVSAKQLWISELESLETKL